MPMSADGKSSPGEFYFVSYGVESMAGIAFCMMRVPGEIRAHAAVSPDFCPTCIRSLQYLAPLRVINASR